ncbi:PREDICTED: TNF receptor-associated factor 6-like [Acropora digitifera]|uniref:TNF receptor-associated factor 6-like n=1 Tax=Acropora digitifera TaxID=70779 RepID=UPI00077A4EAE|nr:PREDICTED: TNF receptor-associated factor 6-like [Acropora digitifera]
MSRSFGTESFRETSTNPEGYDEYFDPPLENKYECPICLLGLREPVQTLCGHRFCRGCILRSMSIKEFIEGILVGHSSTKQTTKKEGGRNDLSTCSK